MSITSIVTKHTNPIAIEFILLDEFNSWTIKQTQQIQQWLIAQSFNAKPAEVCILPNESGQLEKIIAVITGLDNRWDYAKIIEKLPAGGYKVSNSLNDKQWQELALAWGLVNYSYNRFKATTNENTQLIIPEHLENGTKILLNAIYQVRNLITTPAEYMRPEDLAQHAQSLAEQFSANIQITLGDDLLDNNYPAVHAVGRASANQPLMIEMQWGDKKHPTIALVGKGVCFDTGGLDLKTSGSMLLMKKDMGGAAHVLGLAYLIMANKLPVHLQVLIPAVENSVSSNSYRPGDVVNTRLGKTIEISNTDAEGRVILADALTRACELKPQLILDFATLTGAARVALGYDIPAMYCNNDLMADELIKSSQQFNDLVWRLPLYLSYQEQNESSIADLKNSASGGAAGSITAALFLREFVQQHIKWAHFDLMAYNTVKRPGKPIGGEAQGLLGIFEFLKNYKF